MSRQFDQYMADKFELNGELHALVDPTDIVSLVKAFEMRDMIQDGISSLMHDDDPSALQQFLEEQEELIRLYTESLGEFDNSVFVGNIAYLTQKYGIRLGDLEKALGISAGYISRTAKENSGKKMSIDIAWKIARMFNVSLQEIIETEFGAVKGNNALLLRFMDKLIAQTEEGILEWDSAGGVMCYVDEDIRQCGLVTGDEDEEVEYHPDHLNKEITWVLADDMARSRDFADGQDLLIIPFRKKDDDKVEYDFLLVWDESYVHKEDYLPLQWKKMFYTSDDPFRHLQSKAAILYEKIRDTEFDAKLDPDVRDIISGYLN